MLDRTPFYAEAGGQVGDSGELSSGGVRFLVSDTQKRGAAHVHLGKVAAGTIRIGDTLEARVDGARRQATADGVGAVTQAVIMAGGKGTRLYP